jgi:hypothetical protein
MGEIADAMFDQAMLAEMDFDALVQSVREQCNHPDRACRIVGNPYDDGDPDDWMPYRCAVCHQRFDD